MTLRRLGRDYTGFLPKTDARQFAELILGNYELMQMHLSSEIMIHAILSPYNEEEPEAAQTSCLVQNIRIQQQACLNMVNQLVSRIRSVSQEGHHYRDEVFIQVCLRKLGIRNRQELIQMMIKEAGISAYRNELVRLAGETGKHFRSLEKELRGRRPWSWKSRKARQREAEEKSPYYLHNQVFQRLHLEETYQKIRDLRECSSGGLKTPGPEFAEIMQNLEFTDNLFVSRLNESVFGLRETEMFQSFHPYEKWSIRRNGAGEDIRESLLSAILLNLNRDARVYTSAAFGRFPGISRSFWIDLKEAAEKSGQMTAERFFFYRRTMQAADMENQKALMEVVYDGFAREIRILGSIRDMAGRREQEEDTRELQKTRRLIAQIVNERREDFQEEFLTQTGRMLHAVTRIEEEIRRHLFFTEIHDVSSRQPGSSEKTVLVHIQRENGKDRAETKDPVTVQGNRSMIQNAAVRDWNYNDQKSIHLDLAEKSKKEVSRLVRDNIQEQMNGLSDKVYTRLEQRLASEKKRRGM